MGMDNVPETQVETGEFQKAEDSLLCLCPLYEIWYLHCSLSDVNSSCRPAPGVTVCHSRKSESPWEWMSGVIICVLSTSWDRGTPVAHIRVYYRACNRAWLLGSSTGRLFLDLYHLIQLTHWTQGNVAVILKVYFSNSFDGLVSWGVLLKLLSGECHWISLMISEHWFK